RLAVVLRITKARECKQQSKKHYDPGERLHKISSPVMASKYRVRSGHAFFHPAQAVESDGRTRWGGQSSLVPGGLSSDSGAISLSIVAKRNRSIGVPMDALLRSPQWRLRK